MSMDEVLQRLFWILSSQDHAYFKKIYQREEVTADVGFMIGVIEELVWHIEKIEGDKSILKGILEEGT